MGKRIAIVCLTIILAIAEGALLSGCGGPNAEEKESVVVMLPESAVYKTDVNMIEINRGGSVVFTVRPAAGYAIIGTTAGTYANGKLTLDNVQCSVTVHLKTAKKTVLRTYGRHFTTETAGEFADGLLVGRRGAVVIKPQENYYLESVTANGVPLAEGTEGFEMLVDGSVRYECVMPAELNIGVDALGDEYTLGLTCNRYGTAALSVPAGTVHYGEKVRLTTRPNDKCELNYILVNGDPVLGPDYEFTVTGDTAIEVNFIDVSAVSLTYDANGGTFVEKPDEIVNEPNSTVTLDHCYRKITRPGYVLTGFNTQPDGSGESYGLGAMMWLYTRPVKLYAQWAPETDASVFKYTNSGAAVTVTGVCGTVSGRVVIPEKIDGTPVTTIASNAFRGCGMTELVVSANITKIAGSAFYNCRSLKKVTLFDSLRTTEKNIFATCDPDVRVFINATSASDASNLYEGSIVDRWMNLVRKNRAPQLITVSGSSGSCGITPQMVIDGLGLEPNIFGVQQQLGLRPLLGIIAPYVRPGDIVVLCPEYFRTAYAADQGRTDLNYKYFNRNYDMVSLLNYAENTNFFNDMGKNFGQKSPGAIGSNGYHIDKYGCRDYKRPGQGPDYCAAEKVGINLSLIGEGIEIMKKYAAVMRANGAKVYFSFPPANYNGWEGDAESPAYRQSFVAGLRTALNGEIPVISDMEDYFWPGNYFFDSNYHASNTGAYNGSDARTAQLIKDIKAQSAAEGAV